MRYKRLPFDADKKFIVERPFVFNGREYKTPGKIFNPKKAECDERRLRQLYEARNISFMKDDEEKDFDAPINKNARDKRNVGALPKPR